MLRGVVVTHGVVTVYADWLAFICAFCHRFDLLALRTFLVRRRVVVARRSVTILTDWLAVFSAQ